MNNLTKHENKKNNNINAIWREIYLTDTQSLFYIIEDFINL